MREQRKGRRVAGVDAHRHLGTITDSSKTVNKELAARRTAAVNTTKALEARADAPGWNMVEHHSPSVEVAQERARGTTQGDFTPTRAAKRR